MAIKFPFSLSRVLTPNVRLRGQHVGLWGRGAWCVRGVRWVLCQIFIRLPGHHVQHTICSTPYVAHHM